MATSDGTLNFKRPTSEVSRLDPATLEGIRSVVHFKLVAIPGGLPIFDGQDLKGAIGVSGATAQQDEEVARHAITGASS